MSALSENLGAWDGVRGALADIGECHADLDRFLCGVFDDLERLTGELADRQRDFIAAAGTESTTVSDAPLHNAIESLQRGQSEIATAVRGSLGSTQDQRPVDDSLKTVLSRLASLAGELVQSQAEQKRMLKSQQALVSGEMAALRHLLEDYPPIASSAKLPAAAPRRHTVTDPALDAVLAQFERLETELVRNREG